MKKLLNTIAVVLVLWISAFAVAGNVSADFVKTDEGIKYETSDGGYAKSKLLKINKKTYYFDKNGIMKTGFVKLKKGTYYFDGKGVMQTGLKKIDGEYYYFYSDGKMCTSKAIVKDNMYEFGEDGKFTGKANGFVEFNDSIYFCEKGKIAKGLKAVVDSDGEKHIHYFDKDGKMVFNDTVDHGLKKVYINSDGEVYLVEDVSKERASELKTLRKKKLSLEDTLHELENDAEKLEETGEEIQDQINSWTVIRSKRHKDAEKWKEANLKVQEYKELYEDCRYVINQNEKYIKEYKEDLKEISDKIDELTRLFKEAGADPNNQ